MKKFVLFSFLMLVTLTSFSQLATITGTIVDPNGQIWANAVVRADFQFAPGKTPPFNWSGGFYNTTVQTTTDGSGAFNLQVAPNTQIVPSGTTWIFTICPNVTIQCAIVQLPIIGSGDISSNINSQILAPVIPVATMPKAYSDAEIKTISAQGGTYYNVTSQQPRYFDGSVFHFFAASTTPGGSSGQIQYNAGGVFGGLATVNPARGGTGTDTSGSTGYPYINAGVWGTLPNLPYSCNGPACPGGNQSNVVFGNTVGTTLSTSITSSQTTLPVVLASSFPAQGGVLVAVVTAGTTAGELVMCSTVGSGLLSGCVRGYNATIPAAFVSGSTVTGITSSIAASSTSFVSQVVDQTGKILFGAFYSGLSAPVIFAPGLSNTAASFTGPILVPYDAVNSLWLAPVQATPSATGCTLNQHGSLQLYSSGTGKFCDAAGNLNTVFPSVFSGTCFSSTGACGSAKTGYFTVAAGGATATVGTTAVTANSTIFIQPTVSAAIGTALGVTCNTTPPANQAYPTAQTAGTGFTMSAGASAVTNPACFSYLVVN